MTGKKQLTRRIVVAGLVGGAAEAKARGFFGGGGALIPPIKTISGATITPSSFVGGAPDGTVIGSIAVQTTGSNPFTGTGPNPIQVTFTDAAKFKLSSTSLPSNLELNNTQVTGSYQIKLILTDSGFTNSPFTTPAITVIGTSSGAVQVATLTAVNDSASTQAAGNWFMFRGHPFRKGDIPTGTAPQFLVGGVPQPYSWGTQSYWSDGSLKMASFLIRPTFTLVAAATQAIGVWTDGIAPSTSARTLTEIYNQSLSIQATAAPVTDAGITGTWGAWLTNDANNVEQYVYLDGDVGKVWRIMTHMSASQGGAAHGQLECYHYVAALTDASGDLGGFGYLARIMQPWYNNDTPAKNWRAFSTVNWQYGAGPTVVPFLGPNNDGTTSSVNFTWPGPTTKFDAPSNKFYSGASATNSGNAVAAYLTTTGTLPPITIGSLDTNTIYFPLVQSAGASNILLNVNSNGAAPVSGTGAGTGTHTLNPVYICVHFGSIWNATKDAEWNIFQGTGSITTPSFGRAKCDQSYWHQTKVLPPWDESLIGTVLPITFPYDWCSSSIGPLFQYQANTGTQPQLATVGGYSCRHWYTQSAIDEKVVKMCGLAGAYNCNSLFKDVTTRQIMNVSNSSYTGLPAPSSTQRSISAPNKQGVWTAPPSRCTAYPWYSPDYSHKPELGYYAYLLTGQPQYVDIIADGANGGLVALDPTSQRNPTQPITDYGISCAWSVSIRGLSWITRDLAVAAGILPTNMPDGSQRTQYLRDRYTRSMTWLVSSALPGMPSYIQNVGMWMPTTFTAPGVISQVCVIASWQYMFFHTTICLGHALNEDAESLSFLGYAATYYRHFFDTFGGWVLFGYYNHNVLNYNNDTGTAPIASDANWGPQYGPSLSWVANRTPRAFTTTPGVSRGWTLTNGDKFIFDQSGSNAVPAGGSFARDVPYYVVGVVGQDFDLALTPGGTPITAPTNSGSQSGGGSSNGDGGPWGIPISPSTNSIPTPYVLQVPMAPNWIQALGITSPSLGSVAAVTADMAARVATLGHDYSNGNNIEWAPQISF